jgi:hypothetical protein
MAYNFCDVSIKQYITVTELHGFIEMEISANSYYSKACSTEHFISLELSFSYGRKARIVNRTLIFDQFPDLFFFRFFFDSTNNFLKICFRLGMVRCIYDLFR